MNMIDDLLFRNRKYWTVLRSGAVLFYIFYFYYFFHLADFNIGL